ncbi:MAG: PD-(D/E)XK nuclease family protein [Campylobacterales bacterium]
MNLEIWPTSRALRERQRQLRATTQLTPRLMSIENFFQEAILIKEGIVADDSIRLMLLKEAATEVDLHGPFGFTTEFLSFLESSPHLFSFFDEMADEGVMLEELRGYDLYAQYEEHLSTLIELRDGYHRRLKERGFYDRSLAPAWQLNRNWLSNFKQATLYLEGYLTKREMAIIDEVSQILPITIIFRASSFSHGMLQRLKRWGGDLTEGYEYHIALPQAQVVARQPIQPITKKRVITASFSSRLSQVRFLFYHLGQWLNEGVDPEKIAVILPDETLAPLIQSYDTHRILNFAMGFPLSTTEGYQRLHLFWRRLLSLPLTPREERAYRPLSEPTTTQPPIAWLRELIAQLECPPREQAEYDAELFEFERILAIAPPLSTSELLAAFLRRLAKRHIDDVGGGKVTVMGALEGRGVAFEGVIILDANDELLPRPSPKELFLDSQLRRKAGLPTRHERDELQKHYYANLMSRAKRVAIACVANQEQNPSRLLTELGIAPEKPQDELYRPVLSCHGAERPLWDARFSVQFEAKTFLFSSSSLKTLIRCPRRFWLRYLCELREEMESSPALSLGAFLHSWLDEYYRTHDNPSALKPFLLAKLATLDDPLARLEGDLFAKTIDQLICREKEWYEEGWRVIATEQTFQTKIFGLSITGRIDRIDSNGTQTRIIDYKYRSGGSFTPEPANDKMSDPQSLLYTLALKQEGREATFGWLDLGSGKLIEEDAFDKRLDFFGPILEKLSNTTELEIYPTDDEYNVCRYCSYQRICRR